MEAASRMQRERLRLEAAQAHQRAIVIGPAPREAPTDIKPAKKKAKGLAAPDAFVASYPNPDAKEKKKKKAKAPVDGD
ncbi:MAG TPA: hypothetical protein VLJ19_19405 [Variovorax sp.]|nr:hypothetical protein [Variovorax sp.]